VYNKIIQDFGWVSAAFSVTSYCIGLSTCFIFHTYTGRCFNYNINAIQATGSCYILSGVIITDTSVGSGTLGLSVPELGREAGYAGGTGQI